MIYAKETTIQYYKNYADLIEKDNYNSTYAEAFTQDYNSTNSLQLDYISDIEDNKQHSYLKENHLTCWVLDSGASINIKNNIHLLNNIKTCNETIYFANNQSFVTKHIGTYQ
eukprot:jgi/Orpsp1_1/1182789/evm.model.c7180000082664.1